MALDQENGNLSFSLLADFLAESRLCSLLATDRHTSQIIAVEEVEVCCSVLENYVHAYLVYSAEPPTSREILFLSV